MARGSGAGAETTESAESAQAFICGILDYFAGPGKNSDIVDSKGNFKKVSLNGKKMTGVIDSEDKKFNYNSFINNITGHTSNKNWKNVVYNNHVKLTTALNTIETFLNSKPAWFVSSINIANSLQQNIKSRLSVKWNFTSKDYFFYRSGGTNHLMDDINTIFTLVNKEQGNYFRNINRWCPADIYIGNKESETTVKNLLNHLQQIKSGNTKANTEKVKIRGRVVELTFDSINYIFRDLVALGHLLPISLKKSANNFQVVPIKMFNGGPPLKSITSKQEKFEGDNQEIEFETSYDKVVEMNFFSSMDMYIVASSESAKKFGYSVLKFQIRDKSAASGNKIESYSKKWNENSSNLNWKFGIQGMAKFQPALSQGGGIGFGPLNKFLDINSSNLNGRKMNGPNGGGDIKNIVSQIASKICWKKTKFITLPALSQDEEKFIDEFAASANKLAASTIQGTDAMARLDFCLKKLHEYNKGAPPEHPGLQGKLQVNKIDSRARYLVARWFLTKYYCMEVAALIKKNTQLEGLKNIFASALSLDKTGKSGKLGGGSMFFVKAG